MPIDVLAKTLEALRLRGTVYFKADFCAPWGMAVPAGKVAAFHVVAEGACWLRMSGAEPLRLDAGDILLFPHGLAHELVHKAGAQARPATELLSQPRGHSTRPHYGGEGAVTTLVCGHFEYDHHALHPLFQTLPVVHIATGEEEQAAWLATAARLAAAESSLQQHGASVVVDRLAEALLLQTLRLFLERTQEPHGFLAAAQDPFVGRALSSMHGEPGKEWSLDELARLAGLSRSAFSERFRELVGESPIRYLSRWRMLAAWELLRDKTLSTAEVASRVGYESEFAFAKAFKRAFGQGPGAARRAA